MGIDDDEVADDALHCLPLRNGIPPSMHSLRTPAFDMHT